MGSSCSPQSELAQFFLGLAQSYLVAARCNCDCIMCVAQGIKGHADLASSSPSSQPQFYHSFPIKISENIVHKIGLTNFTNLTFVKLGLGSLV
jgi:hypothetical protein